ncbi:hypothetical protein LguiA_001860 [Lonicera macranthoides]
MGDIAKPCVVQVFREPRIAATRDQDRRRRRSFRFSGGDVGGGVRWFIGGEVEEKGVAELRPIGVPLEGVVDT